MEEKIINIENMQIKELDSLKESYLDVKMPEEQLDKLKMAIEKGKMDNRRESRRVIQTRWTTCAAAIVIAFIMLPNASPSVAHAMEKVPFLGGLVKMVTWRDYKYEGERHQADVDVAKLELAMVTDDADNESGNEAVVAGTNQMLETEECLAEFETEETAATEMKKEVLKESLDNINLEIEEITEKLIAEFETHMQEEMGYHDLMIKSEVVADNDKYFTLKLLCFQAAGSGYEWNYYYTIDMATGKQIYLKDLFQEGTDYITVISENIKKQMKEQMAADESVQYWLEEEMDDWNFKSITDETLFYLNEDEQLVISFNEGDVAPMCMGVCEFVIPEEEVGDILMVNE